MKKIIAAMLVLVSCLSVCGCNDEDNAGKTETTTVVTTVVTTEAGISKDTMLAEATEVDIETISTDKNKNIANAKQLYCNKTLLVTGRVADIQEDYIVMAPETEFGYNKYSLMVYLPSETIATLDRSQKITVVGHTTNELEKTEDYDVFVMQDAYLVQDKFEVTGTVSSKNKDYAPAYNFKIANDSYYKLIYFADTQPNVSAEVVTESVTGIVMGTSTIGGNSLAPEYSGKMTVIGKIICKDVLGHSTIEIRDAVIVE